MMKTADVISILEQEFNLNEKITPKKISEKLNTDDDETNEIINTLINENILKTSRKGHYTLNVHKIILYKQKHNLSKNKIKTINNIKQEKTKPQEDKKKANNIQPIKKALKIEDSLLEIRNFINEELIILPRQAKKEDMNIEEIYSQYREYSDKAIGLNEFKKTFHRTINTYPHIRHYTYENTITYNIKLRKTPVITLEKIQENNGMINYNKNNIYEIKENQLYAKISVKKDEIAQIYNLLAYTYENIKNYTYTKEDDKILIEITYDITDEDPDLWIKFIESYNITNI